MPPEDGRFADTLNPSTGEVLCKYPVSTVKDVERAIDAARSAFYSWSKVCKVSDYSLSHDFKIMYVGQERKINKKCTIITRNRTQVLPSWHLIVRYASFLLFCVFNCPFDFFVRGIEWESKDFKSSGKVIGEKVWGFHSRRDYGPG